MFSKPFNANTALADLHNTTELAFRADWQSETVILKSCGAACHCTDHVVRESVRGGTKKGGTLDSLEEMEFCLAAKQGFKLKTKIKQV